MLDTLPFHILSSIIDQITDYVGYHSLCVLSKGLYELMAKRRVKDMMRIGRQTKKGYFLPNGNRHGFHCYTYHSLPREDDYSGDYPGDYGDYYSFLGEWIDGKKDGIHEIWADRGNKIMKRSGWKDGKRHGLSEEWHCCGDNKLVHQTEYKDGKKHGLCKKWNDYSVLARQTEYKDGKKHGKKYGIGCGFYAKDKYSFLEEWIDGKRHGLHEVWYFSGLLKSREEYKNGKRHGIGRKWHDKRDFCGGWGDGKGNWHKFTESHSDSRLAYQGDWKDGKRHGIHKIWNEIGQLRHQGMWVYGKEQGTHEKWDDYGQLRARGEWKDGWEHGVHEEWHSEGNDSFRVIMEMVDGGGDKYDRYRWWYGADQLLPRQGQRESGASRERNGREGWRIATGILSCHMEHKHGRKHGLQEEWRKNGELSTRIEWDEGNSISGFTSL